MHFVRPSRTWSQVTEFAVPRRQRDVTAKDYRETKYVGTVISSYNGPETIAINDNYEPVVNK
jgi:hypothetical protein